MTGQPDLREEVGGFLVGGFCGAKNMGHRRRRVGLSNYGRSIGNCSACASGRIAKHLRSSSSSTRRHAGPAPCRAFPVFLLRPACRSTASPERAVSADAKRSVQPSLVHEMNIRRFSDYTGFVKRRKYHQRCRRNPLGAQPVVEATTRRSSARDNVVRSRPVGLHDIPLPAVPRCST